MLQRAKLHCEQLENRDVPAQFGRPWADHHLSLSFVPDGSSVDGLTSVLNQSMSLAGLSDNAWKAEILRAAQTWLQNADANVSVMNDSGFAIGAPGAPQGDSRFGDIRISARPLSNEELAVTVPPGAGGTRQGDIVLNSDYQFSIGNQSGKYDLYSVMLQEFGHALGIGNSADINSPMYEIYQGVRSGISTHDIETVQALYGARRADRWDAVMSNGSFSNAVVVNTPASLAPAATVSAGVEGDLTSESDADSYKFVVPNDFSGTVAFKLRTRETSLLVGRLSVYQSNFVLKASSTLASPLAGETEIRLTGVQAGETYFLMIDKGLTNNSFAVGQYTFEFVFNPPPDSVGAIAVAYVDDANTNETAQLATALAPDLRRAGFYAINARFRSFDDRDVYRIHPAANGSAPFLDLTLSIRAVDPASSLKPMAIVTDESQNVLPSEVVLNANGEYVIQVANVRPDQNYFISAIADLYSGQSGNYRLEADFRASLTNLQSFGNGVLTNNDRVTYSTLKVNRGLVMHFVLNVTRSESELDGGVRLTLFNAAGHAVVDTSARTYRSASVTKYLAPGIYTMRVTGLPRAGNSEIPAMAFTVTGMNLSDPIGPKGSDPDGPGIYDYEWFEHDDAYYSLQTYDDLPDILS